MDIFEKDKLVFETDVAKWYVNSTTKLIDDDFDSDSLDAPILKNHKCYLIEMKETGYKSYIVIDHNKQEPVAESQQLDGISLKITALRMAKWED